MKPLSSWLGFTTLLLSLSCKKHRETPCAGLSQPVAEFQIKELIGDTAFTADTVFRDNYVFFEALATYESVKWKVGSDPRDFTQHSFTLSFINDLITIPVTFRGISQPNITCFRMIAAYIRGQNN